MTRGENTPANWAAGRGGGMESMMEREEKLKALDAAVSQIEKSYGKGAVMRLGETPARYEYRDDSHGSLSLDLALGLGGIPAAVSLRSTVRSPAVRPRWHCT